MEFPNPIFLIYDNSFQMLISKNFLWDHPHCSIIANLLLPLTIFLIFQDRGLGSRQRIPVKRPAPATLKREAPKCRCFQLYDRFSRMKFFGLLIILIFIVAMNIYHLQKSEVPLTENKRPKYVHRVRESQRNSYLLKTLVEINIYLYIFIYLLKKRIHTPTNRDYNNNIIVE